MRSPILFCGVLLCIMTGCAAPEDSLQDGLTEAQREAKYQNALANMRVVAERHEREEREAKQKQLNHVTSGCTAIIFLGGFRRTCRVLALDSQVSPPLWRIRFEDGHMSEALSQELIPQVEQ